MTPVNDAPVVDVIDDASVAEDTAYTVDVSATDADGDAVSFDVYVDSGSASFDGSALTVTPSTDFNGDITVTVFANDGVLSGTETFTLTVTPVNDAPELSTISDQAIDEDGSLTLTLSASDVDGDTLSYSATNGNATITVDGNTLTVAPEENYNGDAVVTVTVTDGDLSDSQDFTLTVNPVNDAPVVDALEDDSVAEDTAYTVEVSASDVDGDDLT